MTRTLTDNQGRQVRLTEERRLHILDHPEMHGLEPEIVSALREPDRVIRSRTDDAVSLFYRLLRETRVGVKWLCVTVKYHAGDAFVLTAYLTDKPKKGERQWPNG